MEDIYSSSPDPLNNSPTFHSPRKTRRPTRTRQSLPLQSSPKKQTFELDVGDRNSPQKLIVTVEAEHDSRYKYQEVVGDILSSPSRRQIKTRERTTTTTIPVKGLSDSEGEGPAVTPKRGRGRPRKSGGGTPIQAQTSRASTPTRRRKSIGDLVDGDDEDDVNFRIGKNVDIGRRRAKSRSRSTKGASRKSTPASQISKRIDIVSTTTKKRGRGRPRRDSAVEQEIQSQDDLDASIEADLLDEILLADSPQPIQRNDARSEYLSPRSATSNADGGVENSQGASVHSGPARSHEPTRAYMENVYADYPSLSHSEAAETESHFDQESIADIPLPEDDSAPSTNEHDGEEEDQVDELREFDTILESEEFSMISVDSVPSLRQHFSSPLNPEEQGVTEVPSNGIESVRDVSAYNDSFSAIPEGILEAATPARRFQARNHLSVPGTVDNSFSSVPAHVLEAATPAAKTHLTKFQSTRSARSVVDDSFSSVAPDILEAATPGRVLSQGVAPAIYRPISTSSQTKSSGKQPSSFISQTQVEENMTENSHNPTHRLITPDETPSPIDGATQSEQVVQPQQPLTANQSSFMQSYLPSSPPVARRRNSHSSNLRTTELLSARRIETPSIVFSSPALPPPLNTATENGGPRLESERRALSPAARAGQALQNILIPGSPRTRSLSLGSPFKSPVGERKTSSLLQSGLPSPSQERGIKHLPRLDLNNNLAESSRSSATHRLQEDDPFSAPEPVQLRSPSPEENSKPYSLGVPGERKLLDPRIASVKSADVSVLSDDAMSWQAEEEISVPVGDDTAGQASQNTDSLERKWARERAAISKQIENADPSKVIIIASDDEDGDGLVEDDEDLGLLLETINSSSPAPIPETKQSSFAEKPRRSNLPSSWRQNSRKLVYNDEVSQFSSPATPPKPALFNHNAKDIRNHPQQVRRHETSTTVNEEGSVNIPTLKISQKSNFMPRPRNPSDAGLSILLSPIKPLPVMPKSTGLSSQMSREKETAHSNPTAEPNPKVSVPMSNSQRDDPFAPIPQKRGFNPTPRGSTLSRSQAQSGLFAQAPRARLFTPSAEDTSTSASQERSPLIAKQSQALNRQFLPFAQEPAEEVASPIPSDDSFNTSPHAGKENASNTQDKRTLKWTQSLHLATNIIQTPLPDRNVSPTKSCLRTPLLQPQQSPSKNVAFVSSSPIPDSESSAPAPLSSSTWSKKHWLLLESILQTHQAELSPSASSSSDSTEKGGRRRRKNSTRVISKLLGRKVSSQGEEMILEQWHLEVVDEFRGRVPGWEEKTIAMRVFALILGAERRKLGLID